MDTLADVVVYARYSSAGQNDQSIEGQVKTCREFAAQRGFRVVQEYADRAISGRHAETRPAFQQMIADAKKKTFQYILVWKLDRFARNRYDSAIYKKELRKYGVRVLSVTEGIDEGNESILLEAILEAMAEEYSRQLSQNVRRGMRQNAEKGLSLGGGTPYGYRLQGKRYVIVDREAEVVRFIHEAYAEGRPSREIINECKSRGYHTRKGADFTMNAIARMIANDKYAGAFLFKDELVVADLYPPIVPPELKERAKKRLALKARAPGHEKAKVEYILHGKLFCGHCGAPMVGESGKSKSGTVYNYYACAEKKKRHGCKKKNERKDFLEWYIAEQITEYVLTDSRIEEIADAVVAEYKKSFDASGIKRLEKKIKDADAELDKLVDALIKTSADAAVKRINARIEEAEQYRAQLEDDLSSLRIASRVEIKKDDVAKWLRSMRRGDLMDDEYRKKIVEIFVNAVYLYDDRVAIFFNVKDCKQVSYIDMIDATGWVSCSDLSSNALPITDLSEHGKLIILNGAIGFLLRR
nr:MAG TPA: integrase [Caudoviricetes sp.]